MVERVAEITLKDKIEDHRKVRLLLDLNDDCLFEIAAYLKKRDLLSIRLTHSRFKPMFHKLAKPHFDEFTVDQKTLKKYPVSSSLFVYKAIGELTTVLFMYDAAEESVIAILPCFPKLQVLELRVKKLKNLNAIQTFPMVHRLELDAGDTEKNYLKALFQRLASKLEILTLQKNTLRADFTLLPNLKNLYTDGLCLGKKTSFWKSANNLEHLCIENDAWDAVRGDDDEDFYDFGVVKSNWKDIADNKFIIRLFWMSLSPRNVRPGIIPFFAFITDLQLVVDDPRLMLPVLEKIGPLLKKLVLGSNCQMHRGDCVKVVELMEKNFLSLETFYFDETFFPTFIESELQPLYALKKLKAACARLHPPEASFNFARAMPNLTAFWNMEIDITKNNLVAPAHLLESRRKTNRSLFISGKNYFVAPGEPEMTIEKICLKIKH